MHEQKQKLHKQIENPSKTAYLLADTCEFILNAQSEALDAPSGSAAPRDRLRRGRCLLVTRDRPVHYAFRFRDNHRRGSSLKAANWLPSSASRRCARRVSSAGPRLSIGRALPPYTRKRANVRESPRVPPRCDGYYPCSWMAPIPGRFLHTFSRATLANGCLRFWKGG